MALTEDLSSLDVESVKIPSGLNLCPSQAFLEKVPGMGSER